MTSNRDVTLCREAAASDAGAIAALHADSWRRNYRGAYSDAYLDGHVLDDRLTVWTDRLTERRLNQRTIVAEVDGVIVGFAHTILGEDVTWGALLDNLHVTHDLKGRGIGTTLMAKTAGVVLDSPPSTGLYLWVLEQNTAAQAFYQARGGSCVERDVRGPSGGACTRVVLRYAWPDPGTLLRGS